MQFKGSKIEFSKLYIFLSVNVVVTLVNTADPDEMQQMLHFIWVFTVCQSTHLAVSSIKRVKRPYNTYDADFTTR